MICRLLVSKHEEIRTCRNAGTMTRVLRTGWRWKPSKASARCRSWPPNAVFIHTWKRALREGAADIFERGGRKKAQVDEETVRELHAKIGELAVANDFLARKLKPWTGK